MRTDRDTTAMRWVVVQNGGWLGYQIPLALEEAGRLEAVATDWYTPMDRPWYRPLARALPGGVAAGLARRYRPGLPSRRVRSWPDGPLRLRLGSTVEAEDHRLGVRGGRLAAARGAGVFSFSYYAYGAFSSDGGRGLPRLLHQVHPHPGSLRALFLEEMELAPEAMESLRGEHEVSASAARLEQVSAEPHMADLVLAASRYTRRTLVENGVSETRIRVVPYGVDLEAFHPPARPPRGPFRVLFVGQMVQRKGLSYLLQAWRRLALPNAELVLAGRGGMDTALLARYRDVVRVETGVSAGRLRELYQGSDVFCMPSLAEGAGMVYLEALACGTPIIGTPNTGAADVIDDGAQGFLVPIRDAGALAERLLWCYENRDALAAMREAARARAERFTWAAFRRGVADFAREAENGVPAGART